MVGEKNTEFPKSKSGIEGLDEITGGGFPKGRSTLICGSAGCGKTLMGIQFFGQRGHDSEPARCNLVNYPEIKQDNTVGYIFLQTLASQGTFSPFTSDNSCYTFRFKPLKQSSQF